MPSPSMPAASRDLTQRPRMLIIFNPTAGQRKQHKLTQTVQHILQRKWDVTLKPTHQAGDAIELAKWAVEDDKYEIVTAAGGDGTINEVVTGLLEAKGHHVPLGIIPLGTANVLANELGYGKTPESWAKSLTNGLTKNAAQTVHLGEVEAAQKTRAFIWRSVQLLCKLKQTQYNVKIDGQDYGTATAVVACNGRFYGGRFVLAPQARLTEDKLYFAVFSGTGLGAVVRLMVGLGLNRAHKLKGMQLVRGHTLEIHNGKGEPIQIDGDDAAKLPAVFRMAEGTVTVIKP